MDEPLRPGDLSNYLATVTPAERELKRLFGKRENLTLFDIGACEGEESIRYARAFPSARIYAFEPLPANHKLIRENFSRYGITSAELFELALSDKQGSSTFHVSSGKPPERHLGENWNYGNKSSSLLPPASKDPMFGWLAFGETISVPTHTIDGFCASHSIRSIDFIHMDVQGAEHLVLAGASRMLPQTTSVWLEVAEQEFYRGQPLRSHIEQLMSEAGFEKTLDFRRGPEGDQFYVNRRALRVWPYILARRFVAWRRGST